MPFSGRWPASPRLAWSSQLPLATKNISAQTAPHPIFSDLRAIVLKTVGLAEPIKTALASTPERIELALIYGSSAKQSDHASSDVDLLIVSERLSLEQVYELLSAAEKCDLQENQPDAADA